MSDLDEIVEKFKEFDSRILFSAEGSCWPDASLSSKYPFVARGKRFLNSGGFIGYATNLYSILTDIEIGDEDDDQLLYTKIYLDPELREKHKIKLDHKSEIFQNLYDAVGNLKKKLDFFRTNKCKQCSKILLNQLKDLKAKIIFKFQVMLS